MLVKFHLYKAGVQILWQSGPNIVLLGASLTLGGDSADMMLATCNRKLSGYCLLVIGVGNEVARAHDLNLGVLIHDELLLHRNITVDTYNTKRVAIGRNVAPHARIDRGTLQAVSGLQFGSAADPPSRPSRGKMLLLLHHILLTYLVVAVDSILLRIHVILLLKSLCHLSLFIQ